MTALPLPNAQPREPQDYREDGSLDVISVFHTIQGEGPFAGVPAVFVRLAGCTLECPFCDTNYTVGRNRHSVADLVGQVRLLLKAGAGKTKLVVITGGEPFRQNLAPFVRELVMPEDEDVMVQVETNGAVAPPEDDFPWIPVRIVVSPKTAKLHPAFRDKPVNYKYVVEAGHVAEDGLPDSVLGNGVLVARPPQWVTPHQIYVQPMDSNDPEKNAANVQAAVASCLRHGYRLCLQLHKIVNLP